MTGPAGPRAAPGELAVVMPVYNEAACIAGVVEAWLRELEGLGMDFTLILLDDGSRDGTAAVLASCAADPRIMLLRQENRGHGPTILRGYRLAVGMAEWVFQTDSDDEIGCGQFRRLWEAREGRDAVLGSRRGRQQGLGRRILSAGSRAATGLLFAPGVADPNVPFRLIRAGVLRPILDLIPPTAFAPNVLITGALRFQRRSLATVDVAHRPRRTGATTLRLGRLPRVAGRCLGESLAFRVRLGRPPAPPRKHAPGGPGPPPPPAGADRTPAPEPREGPGGPDSRGRRGHWRR